MINVTSTMDRFTAFVCFLALACAAGLDALGAYAYLSDIAPDAGFDLVVQGSLMALAALFLAGLTLRVRIVRKG